MNNLPISRPPFVEWKGKRVMTLLMIAKFLKKNLNTLRSVFFKHKEQFIVGRDAYLIDGTEAYDYLPEGTTPYGTNQLWLITESGYQILSQIIKDSQLRKKKYLYLEE